MIFFSFQSPSYIEEKYSKITKVSTNDLNNIKCIQKYNTKHLLKVPLRELEVGLRSGLNHLVVSILGHLTLSPSRFDPSITALIPLPPPPHPTHCLNLGVTETKLIIAPFFSLSLTSAIRGETKD